MKTQIVYVLVSSDNDLYLEELWASIFSLRRFHPETIVRVLSDHDTERRIKERPELRKLINDIVCVTTPAGYNAKQRSRYIKTTIRQVIDGSYLFIDTDTIICKPLNDIDDLACDIAAVPDGHLPLKECLFSPHNRVKQIWGQDVSQSKYWFNSGVMYVADNKQTRAFYKDWNRNWTYSCFEKGNSQDQPALLKTDWDWGGCIQELPGIYNAQVAMSLKYFADAAILHWWHMDFIEDQSYSPYFSLSIYQDIRDTGEITPTIKDLILNCKSSFVSPSMPIGKEHILFLFTPAGKKFISIYRNGGIASFLMTKCATWLGKLSDITKK